MGFIQIKNEKGELETIHTSAIGEFRTGVYIVGIDPYKIEDSENISKGAVIYKKQLKEQNGVETNS